MTCGLFYHSETAAEPRKALWEGVETAVLENTKFKKDAFNVFINATVWCVVMGDKLNQHMAISYAGIKVVWMIILF